MKVYSSLAVLAATVSFAACAPTATPDRLQLASADGADAQSCLYMNQVTGYRNADENKLLITASLGRALEADFVGRCPEMDPTVHIQIRPEKTVSSRLCNGDYARLTISNLRSEDSQCRVRIARLLTEEEASASLRKNGGQLIGRTSQLAH